jgi:hypothetical protein
VVHWYTVTQLCSPVPTVSKQSQFNSWWYTGALVYCHTTQYYKHIALKPMQFIFDGTLVHCHTALFPSASKVNLTHGGTRVQCHTTQYLSTHCFPTNAVYIVVVHWYTVTQLCSPVPTVSNQSQFNSWWYTGTLSHNFVSQCLLSPTKVNLIRDGTLVHCYTTQYFSKHCFQLKAVLSFLMVYQCTTTQKAAG